MTVGKNFSKALIWEQSQRSSSIFLEVIIVWTQPNWLNISTLVHLGKIISETYISAKNYRNIKKFMTVEKNFSKAVIWDQAQRSSLIRLEVTTVQTQSKWSSCSLLVHLGKKYFQG